MMSCNFGGQNDSIRLKHMESYIFGIKLGGW